MVIFNPNKNLFNELESFLKFYYSDTEYPISIYKSYFNEPHILYNTEQMTRSDVADMVASFKDNTSIIEIWDYSIANIEILKNFGIKNIKHVPLKIWPEYSDKLLSFNPDNSYDYDVGFCGWVTGDRRINILDEIYKAGISLEIIRDNYGEERDKKLAKCQIILNIHFNEKHMIFEQCRCFPWLDTGKTVVSEHSLDNDPRCINVNYEDILSTLIGLLNK